MESVDCWRPGSYPKLKRWILDLPLGKYLTPIPQHSCFRHFETHGIRNTLNIWFCIQLSSLYIHAKPDNKLLAQQLPICITERGIRLWLCAEAVPLLRQRYFPPWLSQLQPEEEDWNIHTGSKQFGSGLAISRWLEDEGSHGYHLPKWRSPLDPRVIDWEGLASRRFLVAIDATDMEMLKTKPCVRL